MGIIVPEKIYIGFQERIRFEGERGDWREEDTRTKSTYRLGFATYLEDNAKFRKRKETITRWTQPYKKVFREDPNGRETWIQGREDRPVGFMDKVQIEELQPQIIDNVPRDGFRIPEEVRRYGWSGGNVVWRIVDPRGFELEISSNNLAQIMAHCTLKPGGIIEGYCVWGWDMKGGGKIVLLPTNSDPYKEGMSHTDARQKKVKLSDLELGDRVQLVDGTIGAFLGKYNMLFSDPCYVNDQSGNEERVTASRLARRGAFLTDKKKLYLASEPKVSYLKEKVKTPLTPELAVAKINEMLKSRIRFGGTIINSRGDLYRSECPAMAFVKKPKPEDFELALVPLEMDFQDLVATQKKETYDRPDGFLYSRNSGGILQATILGWDTYGGPEGSKYKNVLKGKVVIHNGIFSSEEKKFGVAYRWKRESYSIGNYRGCQSRDIWISDANTRHWLYPTIKHNGEEYPLIYIPKK